MMNKIEILSQNGGCRRTHRIINSIKRFLEYNNVEFELQIISKSDEFIKYNTWILPTVVINNKIVSRGYRPLSKVILDALN